MKLLPIMSRHYSANSKWEYPNVSGRSCHPDLTPNSPYLFTRNCVKVGGEIFRLDFGS